MINQKIKILLIIVIGLAVARISSSDKIARALQDDSESMVSATFNSNSVISPTYAQLGGLCQKLGQDYRKVYAFLTHNYRIGICLQGEQFYYYRQSKSNPQQMLLLKATTVLGGNVFKAKKGKVTYFVGTNANGYYSSVMQPNHEIVVEPEVKLKRFDVNLKDILDFSSVSSESNELTNFICLPEDIQHSSKIEPNLGELLGKNSDLGQKDAILYSSSCL